MLSWGSDGTALRWNVYRDGTSNPAQWGAPHAPSVGDDDLMTPGIQYRDVGAIAEGSLYYLVTGLNPCGESLVN